MNDTFGNTIRLLERSFTCALIAARFDEGEEALGTSATNEQILSIALPNRYSQVPLWRTGEASGHVLEEVAIVDLAGKTVTERRAVSVSDLIASDTPMPRAIGLLTKQPFYFVVCQSCVQRILTASDLNKLPVRMYLSVLLFQLEALLAQRVSATFPNEEWMEKLSDPQQRSIRDLQEQKKEQDFDTTLLDCATLTQKISVFDKTAELRELLQSQSRTAFKKDADRVKHLRNVVDHPTMSLVDLGGQVETLRDHIAHGNKLTKTRDLAWLYQVVSTVEAWITALSDGEEGGSRGA